MWRDRSVGKGALTYADGNLYIQGENNVVGLAEATPDRLQGEGAVHDRRSRACRAGRIRSSAAAGSTSAIRARWRPTTSRRSKPEGRSGRLRIRPPSVSRRCFRRSSRRRLSCRGCRRRISSRPPASDAAPAPSARLCVELQRHPDAFGELVFGQRDDVVELLLQDTRTSDRR